MTWATRNRVYGGGSAIDKQRYGAKQTSYQLTVRKFRHFVRSVEVVLDERSTDKGVVTDTIAANPRSEEREGGGRKTRHRRSSDFQERCADDVLKSCKRTGRASLRLSSVRKAGHDATPGPRVQRLADTVDEFQLDCKSNQPVVVFYLVGSSWLYADGCVSTLHAYGSLSA